MPLCYAWEGADLGETRNRSPPREPGHLPKAIVEFVSRRAMRMVALLRTRLLFPSSILFDVHA